MSNTDALRALPSVDKVLAAPELEAVLGDHGRSFVVSAARAVLDEARSAIADGGPAPDLRTIAERTHAYLAHQSRLSMRSVFNLTGTVIHTNLGRAVLAEAAIAAAVEAMREAVTLEFDLGTGRRGERDDHLRQGLCALTGAEDATVVNNNAAAVLLVLNTLGAGREAIVSRGELIEIGGAFRMPDIMARAGTRLVEVGTTNRTHLQDYRAALGPETGLVLKVHTSNYRIQGFAAEVGGRELATLAREAGVPLVHDLGSGTLVDLARYGLRKEPTVRESLDAGADLVTFSGDKLLGGPQAGFILGRRDLIAAINRNPMKRALRIDKIRSAAIAATLALYRDPDRLHERLPTLRSLSRPVAEIEAQAKRLLPRLATALGPDVALATCACRSQIGSGALPVDTIASAGLRLAAASGQALEALAARLRALPRPVIGRVTDGALVLDLRCLEDEAAFIANLPQSSDHG